MRIKYIKKNFCGMLALLFISVLGSNSRLLAQQMENNILRLDGIRIEKGESSHEDRYTPGSRQLVDAFWPL